MFLRLCLRFSVYFILSAIALQALFLVLTLIVPGATKIGYEVAAAFPAAYLLGRAEPRAPALLSALVISHPDHAVVFGPDVANDQTGGHRPRL